MIRDERHSQVYRKANSFVAIKHDALDAEKVLGRVGSSASNGRPWSVLDTASGWLLKLAVMF